MNTFSLRQLIVVEDGPSVARHLQRKYPSPDIHWISTGRRVGQIAAIDYAYSRVATPYIFHIEDDWEFYKPGFVERSLVILRHHPKCLQVWLRSLDDTNGHPVAPTTYHAAGVRWRKLAFDYGDWHGFSFNPGLRRLRDYVALGGYGSCASFDFHHALKSEAVISRWYREKGYFAAILVNPGRDGYLRHIGDYEHVGPPPQPAGRGDSARP